MSALDEVQRRLREVALALAAGHVRLRERWDAESERPFDHAVVTPLTEELRLASADVDRLAGEVRDALASLRPDRT